MTNHPSVGKDTLAFCNRCKLNLAHLIVAMKDSVTPAKVMCNTCKSTHSFKAKSLGKKSNQITAYNKTRKSGTKAVGKNAQMQLNVWQDALDSRTTDFIQYTPKTSFKVGDVINHPQFGEGVVDRAIDANKIEVIFKGTTKTLMHNLA
jgi:hypothetical protein